MKKIASILVLCALVSVPAFADVSGGTAVSQRLSGYYSGAGGEFTLSGTLAGGGPGLTLDLSGYSSLTKNQPGSLGTPSFQTFCVEQGSLLVNPMDIIVSTTTVEGINFSHAVLGGKPAGDDLDSRTAYLYSQFATGVLSNYDYTAGTGRGASASELQEAIWYLENLGDTSLPAGATTSVDGQAADWIAEAEAAIASGDWSGIGDVRILNMYKLGHAGDLEYTGQDLLYMVPVPGAILLGFLGLGTAGLRLRKRS
jgi:hypothetical protein